MLNENPGSWASMRASRSPRGAPWWGSAGGGAVAEALSGLGRAFIYAGARSLLVSHWAVYSDATVKLITGAVREMASDAKVQPRRGHAALHAGADRQGLQGGSTPGVLGAVCGGRRGRCGAVGEVPRIGDAADLQATHLRSRHGATNECDAGT